MKFLIKSYRVSPLSFSSIPCSHHPNMQMCSITLCDPFYSISSFSSSILPFLSLLSAPQITFISLLLFSLVSLFYSLSLLSLSLSLSCSNQDEMNRKFFPCSFQSNFVQVLAILVAMLVTLCWKQMQGEREIVSCMFVDPLSISHDSSPSLKTSKLEEIERERESERESEEEEKDRGTSLWRGYN